MLWQTVFNFHANKASWGKDFYSRASSKYFFFNSFSSAVEEQLLGFLKILIHMNECFLWEWLKPAGSRQIDVKRARHYAGSVGRELDSAAPDTVNCGLLPDIPVAWTSKPFHRHTQKLISQDQHQKSFSAPYTAFPSSLLFSPHQSYANSRMWDLLHSNCVWLCCPQSACIARLATSKTNVWQQRVRRILEPDSWRGFSVTILSLLIDWPSI